MYIVQNPALCKAVNRLNLELLTFGHAQVDPEWSGSVVSPLFTRLYYITDGSFTVCSNRETNRLTAGSWYLIPSGYSFDYSCSERMAHYFFHLKLSDFDGTDLLRNCQVPLCLKASESVNEALLLQCAESDAPVDGLRLRQIALDILLNFIEYFRISIRTDDYSPCIYKALVYIKQNLSMSLTISEIAENIFVSKSTLTKHFQKELHMSVNTYICNTIMAEAERLLITSNISIHDLSQRLGFSDQLYFSRRFKEKFGKSPRQYRKEKPL